MASTFHSIHLHVIFSTKGRVPFLTDDRLRRLCPYLGGILNHNHCIPVALGGYRNHVHILFGLPPRECLADVLREVKGKSSHWVRETLPDCEDFGWQDGYAAFSVSPSRIEAAVRYIENQESHHRGQSFEEEYLSFLQQGGVEFDDRYVFEEEAPLPRRAQTTAG